jgi:hypothetical protein
MGARKLKKMDHEAIDRAALVRQIAKLKGEDEAKLFNLRKRVAECQAIYDKWDEPRRNLRAAIAELESAASQNEGEIDRLAGELAQDAFPLIDRARRTLTRMNEETLASFKVCGDTEWGRQNNSEVVNERASAIRAAIARVDELRFSDADIPAALKEIFATIPTVLTEH